MIRRDSPFVLDNDAITPRASAMTGVFVFPLHLCYNKKRQTNKNEVKMLSVCIPVKNRITNLKACLEALEHLTGIDEVVIGDFNSTDTDYEFLKELDLNVKVVKIDGHFSVGKGKNVAAENASGDILFFLDADLITPQRLIDKLLKLVPLGFVYSPIMWIEQGQDTEPSHWAVHGRGQIALSRDKWENHKWVEWNSYGGDDNLFFEPYKETAIVDLVDGFIHQWHHNSERNKHYKRPQYADLQEENARREAELKRK